MSLEDLSLHKPSAPLSQQDIEAYAAAEALQERQRQRSVHTSTSLEDIDLEGELALNFSKAKAFLSDCLSDEKVPPNQVAQVMGVITTILGSITKLRTDLYNAERLKAIELALVDVMKKQPKSVQDEFFAKYEVALEQIEAKIK